MTSEIKVNRITPTNDCGTTVIGESGDSVQVEGSLKSNALNATDGGSIISQSGTTITLGASGDTITLASGASQTGFGRTGTVDWQTGSIKTSTFTAASGEGYFCDTSGGSFTVNLPAGSAGAIVSLADYTRTWQTNSLTVSPNGSEKIGGVNADSNLDTEGQSVTLVFVDATEGWINVQDSTSAIQGRVITPFIVATGGTITTSGDDKIHTFTGPGTFCVTNEGTGSNQVVSHLVVAGGGGGAHDDGGGGGAGGFRENESPVTPYTASPLKGGTAVTISSIGGIPVTVGAGGNPGVPGGPNCGFAGNGSNSIFSTITSAGGGFGARSQPSSGGGGPGGSGGGADAQRSGGTGNTPPTTPAQGTNGGNGTPGGNAGGGGGGATGTGSNGSGSAPGSDAGPGGAGATTSITGSPVTRGGGGGGGGFRNGGSGGPGGGGQGMSSTSPSVGSGSANTGGGGGGGATNSGSRAGGAGGSGIVVIRYKFQ
jgi:hypothetical protein